MNNAAKDSPSVSEYPRRFLPGIGHIYDVPAGLDWVHPDIAVKDAGALGLGLVALSPIPKGEAVILFGGKLMNWDEIKKLPEFMWDIPYQVTDDIFFGIPNPDDIGVGEKINHSCDPNSGFVSEMKLVAIRDISPGDDVTMDYATCSWIDGYYLECQCGATGCRGKVTGDDWKSPDLQEKLGNYYQPYLKKKMEMLPPRSNVSISIFPSQGFLKKVVGTK